MVAKLVYCCCKWALILAKRGLDDKHHVFILHELLNTRIYPRLIPRNGLEDTLYRYVKKNDKQLLFDRENDRMFYSITL